MSDLGKETVERWRATQVFACQGQGCNWVREDFFAQALEDIVALADALTAATKSRTNAERKARKARKKFEGLLGDTPAKGVAEKGLLRTVGPNARSDSKTETTQSQSVSVLPGEANEASNRVAVGQTSGSSDIADANGSADVEGRQSLHPTTTEAHA